jgi:protein-L-isoaspartate(D-aspartate) O-methyltransferase|mmetsp:Transcript_114024/g.179495  ORF Transcript_114024/g.179495 Transcript_114024/m.179495 type:complete len:480 (-) Transcript_114024:274-1713(-)
MFMGGPMATSNEAMVRDLEHSRTLTSPECVAAFKKIDRQDFWVPESRDMAYADMPLRHGRLHQSAPHIYARALESMMPLKRGMSFLNVGSGTGYFSCIVSEFCGPDAISDGLDIWPETIAHAYESCKKVGKDHIRFTLGNVYELDVEQGMRYDRIYLGACANARSKYLYRLLEVGGVLIGPFQTGDMQQLRRVVRKTEAHFAVEVLHSVQFATLIEPAPDASLPECTSDGCRASGLKGVPFSFALRELPWSPERNLAYPASFREVAQALVLGRPGLQAGPSLPSEIWSDHVLPWCSRRWFERSLPLAAPSPSKMKTALGLLGDVVKRRLSLRGLGSRSVCDGDADSDGGSTRASSNPGTPDQMSRLTSARSFGSISSDGSLHEHTIYEALDDGRTHIIGSRNDPDEIANNPLTVNDRSGLLTALFDNEMNVPVEGEDEPVEEVSTRSLLQIPPIRLLRHCIGWCRLAMPRMCRRYRLRT